MSTWLRKLLLTALVLGAAGSIAGFATFSAFSSTTSNDSNSFAAGTVLVSDNDAGAAMYSVSGKKPGDTVTTCIKVTYTGTLPADIKLYTNYTAATLATYVDLTIDKGTVTSAPSFPACTNFSSTGNLYTGTLAGFASAKTSFATGVSAYPAAQTQWNQNDVLYYRFTLTLEDNNSANGGASPLTTGAHSFIWEARNQ